MNKARRSIGPRDIERISTLLKERANTVRYEVTVPESVRAEADAAPAEMWDMFHRYQPETLDSLQADANVALIAGGVGLDIESVIDENLEMKIDQTFLPDGASNPFSLADARVALEAMILSDLAAAWTDLICETAREVAGVELTTERIEFA